MAKIKEIKVDARVCILIGKYKGQGGIVTKIGAKHNNNGVYCFVKIENGEVTTEGRKEVMQD